MTAADRAISGVSGQMAVVLRDSDEPYRVHYSTVDIAVGCKSGKEGAGQLDQRRGQRRHRGDALLSAPTVRGEGFRFDEQRRSGSSQPLFRRKIILFLVIPPGEEKGSTPFPPHFYWRRRGKKKPPVQLGVNKNTLVNGIGFQHQLEPKAKKYDLE